MWELIKPYFSNVFIYIIIGLVAVCVVQTTRCYLKDANIAVLTAELTTAKDKITAQVVEFQKLKAMADAVDAKLKDAYTKNDELAKTHAKDIDKLIKSKLPPTASCDDVAKWARDIARRNK